MNLFSKSILSKQFHLVTIYQLCLTLATNCFDTVYYPKIIGSNVTGSTQFYCVTQDFYQNMYIGGSTSDYSVIGDTTFLTETPILVSLSTQTGQWRWAKYFSVSSGDFTSVSSVTTSLDSAFCDIVVAALQSFDKIIILQVSLQNGTVLYAQKFSDMFAGIILPNSIAIDSSNIIRLVYTNNQGGSTRWQFMEYQGLLNTASITYFYQASDTETEANVITPFHNIISNLYFIGGVIKSDDTNFYPSITPFETSNGMIHDSFGFAEAAINYKVMKLDQEYDSFFGSCLSVCMSDGSSTMISKVTIEVSSSQTFTQLDIAYSFQISDFSKCLQVQTHNHDCSTHYFMVAKNQVIWVGYLKDSSSNTILTQNYFTASYTASIENQFYAGIYMNNKAFIAGQLRSYYDYSYNMQTYSKIVGWFMTTESAHSSIEDNYNQLSGIDVVFSDQSFLFIWTFASFVYSSETGTQTAFDALPSLDSGDINLYLADTPVGGNEYTLLDPDLQNITVYVNHGGDSIFLLTNFAIQESCSDCQFSYYAWLDQSVPSGIKDLCSLEFTGSFYQFRIGNILDGNLVGQHKWNVKGVINNGQYLVASFYLIVQYDCGGNTITVATQDTLRVAYNKVSKNFILNPMTVSISQCQLTYSLTHTLFPTMSLSFQGQSLSIILSSITFTDLGTYTLVLKGMDSSYNEEQQNIQLQITNICGDALITKFNLPDAYYRYNIEDEAAVDIFTPSWSVNEVGCGDLSYQLVNQVDNSSTIAIFSINGLDQVVVDTVDFAKQGNYSLRIIATSTNANVPKAFADFIVEITDDCNSTFIDNSNFFFDQIYDLGQSPLRLPIVDASIDQALCGPVIYSIYLNSTLSTQDIYVDTVLGSKYITIDTINQNLTGLSVVDFMITLTHGSPFQLNFFTVNIQDPCLGVTLFEDGTSKIFNAKLNLLSDIILPKAIYIQASTVPCEMSYSVKEQGQSSLPSTITYNSSNHHLSLFDNTRSSPYSPTFIEVIGTIIGRPSQIMSYVFQINYSLDCSLNSFRQNAISTPFTYTLNSGQQPFYIDSYFYLALLDCSSGANTYSCVYNSADCNDSPMFMYFNDSTQLLVQTASCSKLGLHELVFTVQRLIMETTFTVKVNIVASGCQCTTINTTPIPNAIYDVNNGTVDYPHFTLGWTSSNSLCAFMSFVYYADGSPVTSFTIESGVIMVKQSLGVAVGTYDLQIIATIPSVVFVSVNFTINIVDTCSSQPITLIPVPQPDLEYLLQSPFTQNFQLQSWTTDPSFCNAGISYSLYILVGQVQMALPSWISFSPSSRLLTVSTNNINLVGVYQLQLVGTKSGYSSTLDVTLFVQGPCTSNKVTTTGFNISSLVTYELNNVQMNLYFSPFKDSNNGDCGSIEYWTQIDGVPTSDYGFIQFDSYNRQFTIQSNDIANLNFTIIPITIYGEVSQAQANATASFSILFIYSCTVSSLVPDSMNIDASSGGQSQMSEQLYVIGSATLSITFEEFIQTQNCGEPVQYSLEYQNSNIMPTFINSQNLQISREIQIMSDDKQLGYLQRISLKLIGQVTTPLGTVQGYLYIPIRLKVINNSPPQFVTAFTTLSVKQGSALIFTFPDLIDLDQDSIDEVQIDFGQSQRFISGQFPTIFIAPEQNQPVGEYKIKIQVRDISPEPLSQTYQLKVVVLEKDKTQEYNSTTNQTSNNTNNQTQISDPKLISEYIEAYIKSISVEGVVVIKFRQQMKIPDDYEKFHNYSYTNSQSRILSSIDSKFLNHILIIKVKDKNGNYLENIYFDWKVVTFSQTQMTIQLVFNDPEIVSRNVFFIYHLTFIQNLDSLEVVFYGNSKFLQTSDGKAIPLGYTITKQIPKQLRNDGMNYDQSFLTFCSDVKVFKGLWISCNLNNESFYIQLFGDKHSYVIYLVHSHGLGLHLFKSFGE